MKRIYLLLILIIGWIFSTVITFKFSLTTDFKFISFWISSPFKFIDIAIHDSQELSLTSQLIGYIFFVIYGVLCIPRIDLSIKTNLFILITFFLLILIVFASDIYSFIQDMNGQFTGRHLRIGATVFSIGLIILLKIPRLNTIKD
jgi:hypothetical protein